MATTQITPDAAEGVQPIETRKTILDLASKADVELVKSAPQPPPISSMEDFVTRMGNDAANILKYANVAYLEFFKDTLASNPDVPWMLADEDESGAEVLVPFEGVPINPDKEKGFRATVIQIAKNMYGYAKNMVPGDVEANRKAKAAAKAEAQSFLLSNPVAVERLK